MELFGEGNVDIAECGNVSGFEFATIIAILREPYWLYRYASKSASKDLRHPPPLLCRHRFHH